jgi:hypothetical protein
MNLFRKKDSEKSDKFPDFNLMHKMNWIRGEMEFHQQPPEYQMRATPDRKVTLGMLLHKTFDVRKEEISDMYVVSNYFEKTGTLIRDEDEIWDYDLCSPILWRHEDGGYGFKHGENVVLIISYRRWGPKDNDKDRSIGRSNESIIVHLRASVGGGIDSFYICATICIPPFPYEKQKTAVTEYERLQGKVLSVTYAFDETPSEQKIEEYLYLREEAIEKVNNGKEDDLTELQHYLIQNINTSVGANFYWGEKVLEEKRFWDAIHYFTNVYNKLQEDWISGEINKEGKDVFFRSCFILGYCFCELHLFEKALYYLEIVWPIDNAYKMEYINCLVNKRDFRGINVVQRELDRLFKIKRSEWTAELNYYYQFLRRREAYLFVDMLKLDEAEIICKEMLSEEENKDFALNELAYIQNLRNQKS